MGQGTPLAAIFGCAGPVLGPWERSFFREADPLGLILFQRNCETPDQVRALVASFRDCVGRADAPVLIDQEGGRVQRLKPPHWRDAPAAARFAALYETDPAAALDAVRLNARLIAQELADLGITVDCAPVLDVPQPGADGIIGDRAHGRSVEQITALADAVCRGFLEGGVLPVIKHIPGHGRAGVDSHKALPRVEADGKTLSEVDFAPFRALSAMPWAMTAHVLYAALDPAHPATLSQRVIGLIREDIGFGGLLVSDDLSMQALDGTLRERAAGALAAGCDVALHCNGERAEMEDVAAGCRPLDEAALMRTEHGEAMRLGGRRPLEEGFTDGVARLREMMG